MKAKINRMPKLTKKNEETFFDDVPEGTEFIFSKTFGHSARVCQVYLKNIRGIECKNPLKFENGYAVLKR